MLQYLNLWTQLLASHMNKKCLESEKKLAAVDAALKFCNNIHIIRKSHEQEALDNVVHTKFVDFYKTTLSTSNWHHYNVYIFVHSCLYVYTPIKQPQIISQIT